MGPCPSGATGMAIQYQCSSSGSGSSTRIVGGRSQQVDGPHLSVVRWFRSPVVLLVHAACSAAAGSLPRPLPGGPHATVAVPRLAVIPALLLLCSRAHAHGRDASTQVENAIVRTAQHRHGFPFPFTQVVVRLCLLSAAPLGRGLWVGYRNEELDFRPHAQ